MPAFTRGSLRKRDFSRKKGGARKRADVFPQRKTEQSELCSDVEERMRFELTDA